MSSWEKDSKSDPHKTVQLAKLVSETPKFSPSVAFVPSSFSQCSGALHPHQTWLLGAALSSLVVDLNDCVLTLRVCIILGLTSLYGKKAGLDPFRRAIGSW